MQKPSSILNNRMVVLPFKWLTLTLLLAGLSALIHLMIFTQTDEGPHPRDLLGPYTFSFETALNRRQENMKRYSYPYGLNRVDRRSGLSLQEFYDVYDGVWPVIITDVVTAWPAINWTALYFKDNFSSANIVMTTANKSSSVVKLGWFLGHMDDAYSHGNWIYLQDELFLLQHPQLRQQINTTIYSRGNFFDLLPEEVRPWDCYFLWGSTHSRSSLHIDPYNWTGTSALISGRKQWKLIQPGQDSYLSVHPDRRCGFPLDCKHYDSPLDLFSEASDVKHLLDSLKVIEAEQSPGDLLIIPTGWFHQAYNVETTLAVSQQIMNVNNYLAVLEEVFKAGNLPKSFLTEDVLVMSPEQLVKYIMLQLPEEVLENGAKVTGDVIRSIQESSPDAAG